MRGETSMLDGQGQLGVHYRRSIPSSSHSSMPSIHGATSTPCHSLCARSATGPLQRARSVREKAVSNRLPCDQTWEYM